MTPCITERSSLVLFTALAMALALGLLTAEPVMVDLGPDAAVTPLARIAGFALLAASAWRWLWSSRWRPVAPPAGAISALLALLGLWGIAGSGVAAMAWRHALTAGVAVLFVFSQLCTSNHSQRLQRTASFAVVAAAVMLAAMAQNALALDTDFDLRLVIWVESLPVLLWPTLAGATDDSRRPVALLPMTVLWALVLVASHADVLAGVGLPSVLGGGVDLQGANLALLAGWAAWGAHRDAPAPSEAASSASVGELDVPSRRSTSLMTSG